MDGTTLAEARRGTTDISGGLLPISPHQRETYQGSISGKGIMFTSGSPQLSYTNTEHIINHTQGSVSFWVAPSSWGASGTNGLLTTASTMANTSHSIAIYRNDSTIVVSFTDTARGDDLYLTGSFSWTSGTRQQSAIRMTDSDAAAGKSLPIPEILL